MVGALAPALFKTVVVIVRTLNNVLGGISFVTCAYLVGSQKSAGAADVEAIASSTPAAAGNGLDGRSSSSCCGGDGVVTAAKTVVTKAEGAAEVAQKNVKENVEDVVDD